MSADMEAIDAAVRSSLETAQWLRENGSPRQGDELEADTLAIASEFRALDALCEARLSEGYWGRLRRRLRKFVSRR